MHKFTGQGVYTALVTPFLDQKIDFASFEKLLEWQAQGAVTGVVINGTTGESPTVEWPEVEALVAAAAESARGSQLELILGCGVNSTKKTCEMIKMANTWPVAAFLVVVPYYNKPTQTGLVAHFTEVAAQSEKPILLYDVPGRTVARLTPESIVKLSGIERIVGIKDATGDMEHLAGYAKQVRKNFILLSGDDFSCVDFVSKGGHGVISVMSNMIPSATRKMIELADLQQSQAGTMIETYKALLSLLYVESNPIPIKSALAEMGLIGSNELRLPLTAMSSKHRDLLITEINKLRSAGVLT